MLECVDEIVVFTDRSHYTVMKWSGSPRSEDLGLAPSPRPESAAARGSNRCCRLSRPGATCVPGRGYGARSPPVESGGPKPQINRRGEEDVWFDQLHVANLCVLNLNAHGRRSGRRREGREECCVRLLILQSRSDPSPPIQRGGTSCVLFVTYAALRRRQYISIATTHFFQARDDVGRLALAVSFRRGAVQRIPHAL